MKATSKIIGGLCCAALLIGNTALAQVINGGFETASGGYDTGALGWDDSSGAPAGTTASATRSLLDPFAGVAELTLAYTNSAAPGGGPAVIALSDIFGGVAPGAVTLTFEAKRAASAGFENNQVRVLWYTAANVFLGDTGFSSYNGTLTGLYTLQTKLYVAPATTAKAAVMFLTAGSAVANDNALIRIDDVTLIPEPTTLAMVGLGLLGLLGLRKRKA